MLLEDACGWTFQTLSFAVKESKRMYPNQQVDYYKTIHDQYFVLPKVPDFVVTILRVRFRCELVDYNLIAEHQTIGA